MRIFLSDDDKCRLKQALTEMDGGTITEDSVVLERASEYLIDELWLKESRNGLISLKILEKWIYDQKKLYIPIGKQREYEHFKEQLRQQYGMDVPFKSIIFDRTQLIPLHEEGGIRAKNISLNSLRACTEKNYKKSQKVKKSRGVLDEVIRAYCVALNVDYNSLSVARVVSVTNDNASKLYKSLIKSFDHNEVIQLIENLAECERRVDTFYFPARILYSHVWAYKRLKYRIETVESGSPLVREIIVDLASPNKDWTPTELILHLGGELGQGLSLAEMLKKENIIIILENVDNKSAKDLENIIEQFWYKLTEKIPPMEEGGMCLMLWIDRGKIADWKTLNNGSLLSKISCVSIPERFQQQDFEVILSVLARMFRQQELTCQRQRTVNWFWENSNQGEPEDTLKAFYRRFNLKFESHKTDWEEWKR